VLCEADAAPVASEIGHSHLHSKVAFQAQFENFHDFMPKAQQQRQLFALAVACLFLSSLSAASPTQATRSALQEWVQVEKTISAEREAWIEEKRTTEDLIGLLRAEQALLRAELEAAQTDRSEAASRRAELLATRDAVGQATASLQSNLSNFEALLKEGAPRLPFPLQKRLEGLLRRLPEQRDDSRTLGQRAQALIGGLSEIDQFNTEVTLTTQLQTLPDGRSLEVDVLYLGLGAAYFTDPSGQFAGMLTPAEEGWNPSLRPGLADAIKEAIEQLAGTRQASYVKLPVTIE